MNAITLLKQDHRNVEALFERFGQATDEEARREVVDKIIEHLSVHAAIEEEIFYPAVRAELPELEAAIFAGLEEHHVAEWLLGEWAKLPAGSPRLPAKIGVLKSIVEHHVADEEANVFPKVLDAFPLEQLERLGIALEATKATAPTRPRPHTPDEPPLNILIGTAMAIIDRAVQTGADAMSRFDRSWFAVPGLTLSGLTLFGLKLPVVNMPWLNRTGTQRADT